MNKFENTIELIVRLIIKKDNQFLLCRNKKMGYYFLPGGHVEFGDTMEETIYKEMDEELGLSRDNISNIEFKKYLENSYEHDNQKHCELNMVFCADLKEGIKIESQEDHIDFEWVRQEDLDNYKLLPIGILDADPTA